VSLGDGDSDLLKERGMVTRGKKRKNWQIFKNLLLENYKFQSFAISYEAFLGHGDSSLLKS